MTNGTGRPSRGRAHRVVTFAVFALLALCLPGAAAAQWATSGTNISNTNTGNVGVGNSSPYFKLTVGNPGQQDGRVAIEGADNTTNILFNTGGANRGRITTLANGLHLQSYSGAWLRNDLFIRDDGNVGIGTTSPSARLQVNGAGAYANPGAAEFRLHNTVWNGSFTQQLGDTGTWQLADATTGATKIAVNPGLNGAINLFNGAGNVVVNGTGNVGIGTAAPAYKLDVAGDIRVSGNINAKYQDVAEWVPTTQKLSPGTVVVLDPERSNHVLASTSPYDTRVAGVVSAQPGITLGEAGEGKALVATTGRVKVRVDATRAAIKIGDLLVTSDVAGVAMKSEPVAVGGRRMHAPGTIIGKALEPLASGTGEILVLLSLQ